MHLLWWKELYEVYATTLVVRLCMYISEMNIIFNEGFLLYCIVDVVIMLIH